MSRPYASRLPPPLIEPQAVYQSLVHLTWIDKLLDNVRALFTELYKDQLKKRNTAVLNCPFDDYFDRQVQELEPHAESLRALEPSTAAVADYTPPSSSGTDNAEAPPPMPGLRKRKSPAHPHAMISN